MSETPNGLTPTPETKSDRWLAMDEIARELEGVTLRNSDDLIKLREFIVKKNAELTAALAKLAEARTACDEWAELHGQALDSAQAVCGELYTLRTVAESWLTQGEELLAAFPEMQRWEELKDFIPHIGTLRAQLAGVTRERDELKDEVWKLEQQEQLVADALPNEFEGSEETFGVMVRQIVSENDSLRTQVANFHLTLSQCYWTASVSHSWEQGRGANKFTNSSLASVNGEFKTQAEALDAARLAIEKRAVRSNVHSINFARARPSRHISHPAEYAEGTQ